MSRPPTPSGLISIKQAAQRGFTKLRLDRWANPDDYIEIYIVDKEEGRLGPWAKLWSPTNEIVGNKNPHMMLWLELGGEDDECWRPLPKTLVRT